MGLYVSDEHGLGNFDMALVVLATHTIELHLETNHKIAERICERRQRVRTKFNECRWGLPDRNRS